METVRRRQHGSIYKGHTLPYGTLANASYELKQAYYTYGYLHDEDMPEFPCPKPEYQEYVDPEEELCKKDVVRVVAEMVDNLTPREAKILRMRFGIELTQDYSLEEVGLRFDVTRERIRQIEAKAMRDLKHPSRSEKLRELIGHYVSTAEKEDEQKKLQRQWAKARENARLRDEARARAKVDADLAVTQMVAKADRELRQKWDEIKPMVSDADWIAHLKVDNPAMYQELKYIVGDIWGYNADKVWEMYAEKK
jgi:DNA-binding CsgD family transcriptional regulator